MMYWEECMARTGIPDEAQRHLRGVRDALYSRDALREAFETQAVECMREPQTRMDGALQSAGEMAGALGCHAYTMHFLLLIEASAILRKLYAFHGIADDIFWATMCDLKFKLMECHEVHGVWGTFVGWWYKRIFSCDIFMLGRLQYEHALYPRREPYERAGVRIAYGDPVLSIHIPSCGPLTEDLRMDSYRRAYAFFRRQGNPLVCYCDSWLLFPGHAEFLPECSNIRAFMADFDIIAMQSDEAPHGSWRVFGAHAAQPPETWPEDSGLRRAYKARILSGGTTGGGFGVLLFDGEKILR